MPQPVRGPSAKQRRGTSRSANSTAPSSLVGGFVLLLVLFTCLTGGVFYYKAPAVHEGNTPPIMIGGTSKSGAESPKMNANNGVMADGRQLKDSIDSIRHRFPVHASKDLEEIIHPGVLYADQLQGAGHSDGHGLPKKVKVPKFWETTEAYGAGGIRQYLGDNGKRLMTVEEASNVGSLVIEPDGTVLETIYVGIASYRDYECGPTIESIFARAKHPQRIRVAAICQRDLVHDPNYCGPPQPCTEQPEQAYCKWQSNIDVFLMDAKLSVGPVFARHLGNRMYRGEYFALQVDSHVRFTKDWDDDIILQWKQSQNEMCVLTAYLSDIINSINPETHVSQHSSRPIMCESGYEGRGKLKHIRHGQQPEGEPGIHNEPTLEPYWAAGFSFARGHFMAQVPYDQYLPMVFQGEEISLGLRAWTYGYDFYTAERAVCFHMYAIKENKKKRSKVPLFWEHSNFYNGVEAQAMKRLNGIIGMGHPGDDYDHAEEEFYGLGQIRTTKKFFETFGIHTKNQTTEKGLCTFVGKPMMRYFKPLLRANKMGLDYSKTDFKFTKDWRKSPKPAVIADYW